MDSVPPATMTSAEPARMRSAARAMACKPEEQEAVDGHRAGFDGQFRREARRCARRSYLFAFGHRAARITSSISLASGRGRARSASLIASAADHRGVWRGASLCRHACRGGRTAETMTASGMAGPRRSRIQSLLLGREWGKATPGDSPVRRWSQLSVSSVQSGICFLAYATNPSFVAFSIT